VKIGIQLDDMIDALMTPFGKNCSASNSLSGGAVAGIVIASVAAVGAVIFGLVQETPKPVAKGIGRRRGGGSRGINFSVGRFCAELICRRCSRGDFVIVYLSSAHFGVLMWTVK